MADGSSSGRVGRALRRSPLFWTSSVGVGLLFSMAALAPLLASSAPWLYDDGERLRSPVLEYLGHADWRWLGGLVLCAVAAWRVRRLLRRPAPERSRGLRRLALRFVAVAAGLAVAIEFVDEKVLTAESFLFESLRIDGPREGEWVLWAPVRWSPEALDLENLDAEPPSREHPFGKDRSGGDLFARVVHGARVSLSIGVASSLIALLLGVLLGGLAGFFGGWLDMVISRVIEVFQCFPDLFLILVVLAYLPARPWVVIALLGLLGWSAIARLTRAEFLRLRGLGFVDAARSLGCPGLRIAFVHLLPHAMGPALVAASFGAAGAMLAEAGLSYLGLGGQDASWGRLLQASRSDVEIAPQVLLFPGAMLVAAIASFHFLGEAVRDAADPWARRPLRPGPSLTGHAIGPASPEALLDVRGLCVHFAVEGAEPVRAVQGVDLVLRRGERVGLVGPSGCGKSVTALSIVRLLDEGGARVGGEWSFAGIDLRRAGRRTLRQLRGRRIGTVFQDAGDALDPVRRVGRQLADAIAAVRPTGSGRRLEEEVLRRLSEVGLPAAPRVARSFPHELSGGMQQRVQLAIALAGEPELLIADEPTTGLDVVVQQQVLEHIEAWSRRSGGAVLWISHDLAVVGRLCQRVVVMQEGTVVEEATLERLRRGPAHPFTRCLIEALPEARGARARPPTSGRPEPESDGGLVVRDLRVSHRLRRRFPWSRPRRVEAVRGVELSVASGQIVGLVGESGCGKSSLLRAIVGFGERVGGAVELDGRSIGARGGRERRAWRRRVQLVFQDSAASLDARRTVFDIVAEGPRVHRLVPLPGLEPRVADCLRRVGLDPEHCCDRTPDEFSGGQRARIALARSLAVEPRILLLDEPVAALDVIVQAEILDLLERLRSDAGCGILFVSHDLSVVRNFCDHVHVMHEGRIVESGTTVEVLEHPRTEVAQRLLEAVPGFGGRTEDVDGRR